MSADLIEALKKVKQASRELALLPAERKNRFLKEAASLLRERSQEILEANALDVSAFNAQAGPAAALDRLRLDEKRIESMAKALEDLVALPDPVGEIVDGWVRPNGLKVRRVRVPLGVIAIVYENRPNVTSDAAGLCIKAGNAVVLRGSASALNSNRAIVTVLKEALASARLPGDSIALVEDPSHEAVKLLLSQEGLIDCVIPRGGPGLVATVREHARVPVIIDGDGNCHVYVDASADLEMALAIVVNAKMQRPSVCNAAEKLLIHKEIAPEFLPAVVAKMPGVELLGDEEARRIVPELKPATEEDWPREYLALKMAVKVVKDLDEAIEHINRYSSGHSEAIVTGDLASARRFVEEVDAAAVLVNASTRLVDGGELGLGAEIGISTQKLHARGPMGLKELTTAKFVIEGDGHVRS